ncbi:cysteine desulfurase family protein [Aquirufa lenticrescens]|uniref:cysteine desulfurase family protein n=1 Tax=Aquirufa lenticrescens TaxID=2696560 RepID=UPI001CAA6D09|nr:cysteine desulfurase family protein [Aquirufa lenticrescens]UAJ14923.1 cysteine desulfurase [Aquirufa lenticrescens]
MMHQPIYLDYAATTPVHPEVLSAMLPYFTEVFGNAGSSAHLYGWRAAEAVEQSRTSIASYFQVKPSEVLFTSGATESINLGIRGFLQGKPKGHLITSVLEHKAVLEVFHSLEVEGWSVTYLTDTAELEKAIRSDTVLVSFMLVNNELGTILDHEKVLRFCEEQGICFHSDATQAIGKHSLTKLPHLLSFSGHKIYGPKGIGALIARVPMSPILYGGGQERGLRPGTLPVPLIVGLAKAVEMIPEWLSRASFYHNAKEQLASFLPLINSPENSVPSILNFTLKGADWEKMFQVLNGLAFSNGSACNAKTELPSHVLIALGYSDEDALASGRISLGYFTTEEEIDRVCEILSQNLPKLL